MIAVRHVALEITVLHDPLAADGRPDLIEQDLHVETTLLPAMHAAIQDRDRHARMYTMMTTGVADRHHKDLVYPPVDRRRMFTQTE